MVSMIKTVTRTDACAYVTDHGQDGTVRLFVNVYRDGSRLDACEIPGSQWMDARNALTYASAWLTGQGYTLTSEFVNIPGAAELVGCDYKVRVIR